MSRLTAFFGVVAILFAVLLGVALSLAWNSAPTQNAQADSIRIRAEADARATALLAESQAERHRAELAAESQAAPALLVARQILYIGGALVLVLLLAGCALAFTLWMNLRATLIAPNPGGQFPLLRVGGVGWQGVVDPNKATGVVLLKTPSLLDPHALPQASQPLALSEGNTLQLTAQAAAIAMTSGATRYPNSPREVDVRNALDTVQTQTLTSALPPVTRLSSAAHIDRLLELTSYADGT